MRNVHATILLLGSLALTLLVPGAAASETWDATGGHYAALGGGDDPVPEALDAPLCDRVILVETYEDADTAYGEAREDVLHATTRPLLGTFWESYTPIHITRCEGLDFALWGADRAALYLGFPDPQAGWRFEDDDNDMVIDYLVFENVTLYSLYLDPYRHEPVRIEEHDTRDEYRYIWGECDLDCDGYDDTDDPIPWSNVDADRDSVPDALEPDICRIESQSLAEDGTCSADLTDYTPPLEEITIDGVRFNVGRLIDWYPPYDL